MIRQLILNVGANRNRHCDSSLKYNQDNQWWVQIANVFIISYDGGMASHLRCLLGLRVYTCMGLIDGIDGCVERNLFQGLANSGNENHKIIKKMIKMFCFKVLAAKLITLHYFNIGPIALHVDRRIKLMCPYAKMSRLRNGCSTFNFKVLISGNKRINNTFLTLGFLLQNQ